MSTREEAVAKLEVAIAEYLGAVMGNGAYLTDWFVGFATVLADRDDANRYFTVCAPQSPMHSLKGLVLMVQEDLNKVGEIDPDG